MAKDDTSPADIRYGLRLRRLRDDRGYTQAQMVEHLQRRGVEYMNTSTLSRIEAGTRPVRLTEALAIGHIFRVDVEDMVEGDEAFALLQSRHRYARQRYAAFRDDVTEVTKAQLRMESHTLDALHELAASESNAAVLEKIQLLIQNVQSYIAINLGEEAAELAQAVRRNHDTSAGRYLNARPADRGDDGEHQAEV